MDADAKKTTLRMIPYGIYVLTAKNGDSIGAATVNWVTQTSFDPPLVVVGVKADSGAYAILRDAGSFALNMRGKVQQGVAERLVKLFCRNSPIRRHRTIFVSHVERHIGRGFALWFPASHSGVFSILTEQRGRLAPVRHPPRSFWTAPGGQRTGVPNSCAPRPSTGMEPGQSAAGAACFLLLAGVFSAAAFSAASFSVSSFASRSARSFALRAALSWRAFSLAAVPGAMIWSVGYTSLGYLFATQLEQVAEILGDFFGLILAVAMAFGALVLLKSRWDKARATGSDASR